MIHDSKVLHSKILQSKFFILKFFCRKLFSPKFFIRKFFSWKIHLNVSTWNLNHLMNGRWSPPHIPVITSRDQPFIWSILRFNRIGYYPMDSNRCILHIVVANITELSNWLLMERNCWIKHNGVYGTEFAADQLWWVCMRRMDSGLDCEIYENTPPHAMEPVHWANAVNWLNWLHTLQYIGPAHQLVGPMDGELVQTI